MQTVLYVGNIISKKSFWQKLYFYSVSIISLTKMTYKLRKNLINKKKLVILYRYYTK